MPPKDSPENPAAVPADAGEELTTPDNSDKGNAEANEQRAERIDALLDAHDANDMPD